MSSCKSPLDSNCKTYFFYIAQPYIKGTIPYIVSYIAEELRPSGWNALFKKYKVQESLQRILIASKELKMSKCFPCTESEIATELSKHLPETQV